nr:VanZ family protein [uncultured Gemmiger sp.]
MEHQKTSPWVIAFRVIFTIALIACIVFIFRNSLQAGALSSARSHEVMRIMNNLLGKVGLGPLSEHTVRKLAHFAEFTLEGFLLMLCLRVYTAHFVRHVSWPLLGGMATALTDETIQKFIPGRTSQVTDVWIDMSGVVCGLFVALILLLIVRLITAFHHIKKENRRLRAERERLLREQEEDRINTEAPHHENPNRRELL